MPRRWVSRVTSTSPYESEEGAAKTSGASARLTSTMPAPASSTDASVVRAVFSQAVVAVFTSADLTCRGSHPGWRSSSSAAAPVTCGADMLVPSKTANGPPAPRVVADRMCPPGAARSGLSRWPNAVGPADEKLVTTPPRSVSIRRGGATTRKAVRPPRAAMCSRSRAPSRSEIIPAGITSRSGMPFASPGRLSTTRSPVAPAARARRAFESNVQTPRETRTTVPESDPGGSMLTGRFTSPAGPQRRRSTGRPSIPTIVPTSTSETSTVSHASGIRPPLAGTNGNRGPSRTSISPPKTWRFDAAATEIASGTVPGEPEEPRPNSSRSFPAEMTGTTPAAVTLRIVSTMASLTGSVWGPPPEKLITSMPSITADSNAATISGVLATLPIGVGTVKTR